MESRTRGLGRIVDTPPPAPGFAGPGHTAVEVLAPNRLLESDPFVLLMDDRLNFSDGQSVGGAHPHAGLETVTLVLEGSVQDRDEGVLNAGDALWMTAGRGIIHNESVLALGNVRVLQLWVTLPVNERSAEPDFELIPLASLPIRREPGVVARLYSGTTGALSSPTRNRVPVTLVHALLEPGASFSQELPDSYNGFLYVVGGTVRAGEGQLLETGQVGWLDRPRSQATSTLRLRAGDAGASVVLYAGEPQRQPVIQHGPFVAGSAQDIARLFGEYRAGRFKRMSEIAREKHGESHGTLVGTPPHP